MPKQRKYTDNQLIDAVHSSRSIREVLIKIGLNCSGGGNYSHIQKRIKDLNLSISHILGQKWNFGSRSYKVSINDYLSNKKFIYSHKLRIRLIEEGIKKKQCEICNNSTWNGKPLILELDHIDGNKKNNALSNLRILCPNCHSQTDTYKIKNKK